MYNRYIRNDNGIYTRIPQKESTSTSDQSRKPQQPESSQKIPNHPPQPPSSHQSGNIPDGLSGFLRHFLDQFHLDHVDTGDLLLLILLFFLFKEDSDEELLVALGLLLIL